MICLVYSQWNHHGIMYVMLYCSLLSVIIIVLTFLGHSLFVFKVNIDWVWHIQYDWEFIFVIWILNITYKIIYIYRSRKRQKPELWNMSMLSQANFFRWTMWFLGFWAKSQVWKNSLVFYLDLAKTFKGYWISRCLWGGSMVSCIFFLISGKLEKLKNIWS